MQASEMRREPVTSKNFESASLDQWQYAFYELYGHVDRTLPLYDIMLQMIADSTRIAEAMRRGSYNVALPFIPRVFSWLCSMTSKVAGDDQYRDIGGEKTLADLIWHKYPHVCAFCAESKCLCPALHVDAMTASERAAYMNGVKHKLDEARKQLRPIKLNDWVQMFEDIYGTVNASRSSAQKTFHFLEEIGEVEVELRKADRKREDLDVTDRKIKIEYQGDIAHVKIEWEDEVADVFSWLTAVYLHLKGALDDFQRLISAFVNKDQAENTSAQLQPMYSFAHWVWLNFGKSEGAGKEVIGLRCHRCTLTKCNCAMIKQRR